jgi:hypothetical protein
MRATESLRRALGRLVERARLARELFPRAARALRALLRGWVRSAWLRHAPRTFLFHARPTPHELGLAGEELAARALLARGYRLLGRRLHTPHAEVDLWATRDDLSWAGEVKTGRCARLPGIRGGPAPRWDLRWRPALSLAPDQRHRLARAARYLGLRVQRDAGVLLVEVLVDPTTRALAVLEPVRLSLLPKRSSEAAPWRTWSLHPPDRGASEPEPRS